jgi:DNA polymerase I-like protein with 3'-5' exonuclease and polymerase domains
LKPVTKQAARLFHDGQLAMSVLEHNGIRIDVPYLKKTIKEVGEKINAIESSLRKDAVYKTWHKHYGENTKLGSKEQLAKIIFGVMGQKRHAGLAKKAKSDEDLGEKRESKYDQAAFSEVDLPFIKEYFHCEKLKKLLSTYLRGVEREMVNSRIHPFFNLHTAVTYRSSSEMPNFQNIPKRNKEIMELIRRCFIPSKGRRLVEIDFSGVEVRVACCYTKDPRLISEFTGPDGDPHGDTAVQLFMLPKDFVRKNKDWAKKTVRDFAKNRFVFPSFYGSVYFQCAPHLWEGVEGCPPMPDGTPLIEYLRKKGINLLGNCEMGVDTVKGTFVDHVKRVEESFWNERFVVYTAWKKRRWQEYLRDGGFNLHTGFACRGIYKKNDVLNYPIQGSAFHCLLWSLIELIKALKKYKMKSKMIGQIHDCFVGDVVDSELQNYLDIAYEITTVKMPKAFKWITVPMDVECEVAGVDESWLAVKEWKKKEGTWSKAA